MDQKLDCKFYFGSQTNTSIKKLDYNLLKGFRKELKYLKLFKQWYWLRSSLRLLFGSNQKFILNGQLFCLSDWFILLFGKLLGKNIFIWTHGWYGSEKGVKKKLKKIYYGLSSGVFLYGNYAKELMVSEGINSKKLHLIYNSLDYDNQKTLRANLKLEVDSFNYFQENLPVVIFIGRLLKGKNLDLVFESLQISKDKERTGFNILIIGDGPDLDRLRRISEEMALESNIHFYGACYDEIVLSKLIHNASICISPGYIGLTVIHSLSYGTPAMTHDDFTKQMPEFEAIIPGETGDFFKKEDAEDLSFKLNGWFAKYPEKSKDLIDKCYAIIDEKYNPNYQIEMIKKVIS